MTTTSERNARWEEWAIPANGTGYSLNIVFLYQDGPTRKWAKEVYERVTRVAGPETARATWWRISELSEPGVLAGAVSTTMRADVIVVAVRTGEGLPLPFYVWVNAWLPHRAPQTGALVALLGAGTQRSAHMERVRSYLQMVARQSKLDFLPEQRELPNDDGGASSELEHATTNGNGNGRFLNGKSLQRTVALRLVGRRRG